MSADILGTNCELPSSESYEVYQGERGKKEYKNSKHKITTLFIVQELCEIRGGRPGLSVLTSLLVSVDVKQY